MPQLSPHMESGSISKWLKKEGNEIATYDVIFEVDTKTLSEEAYKIGDFAGTVTMLVEVSIIMAFHHLRTDATHIPLPCRCSILDWALHRDTTIKDFLYLAALLYVLTVHMV